MGMAVPERVVTNHDMEKLVDTSDEWIVSRTGMKERRFVAPGEATSDLASRAGLEAIRDAGLTPADVDLIVVCTFTPDMNCPSTACLTQLKIGARECPAYDLNAACSGFLYGMATAQGLIQSGVARNALVIGSDVMSPFTDFQDRNTCVLFGDGAGAVMLGRVEEPRGIRSAVLGARGTGWDLIMLPAGGSVLPASEQTVRERKHYLRMNGSEVFKFAVRILGEAVDRALEKAGLTPDDIDLLVPHQANIRIIDAAAKRYGMSPDRVMVNVQRYANTSAATIPIALAEARAAGRIGPGKTAALVAFGGGLTYAASIVRF